MRINKYLSNSGVDSRRKCEAIILSARVKVNGKIVTTLAFDVKEGDEVTVDDKPVFNVLQNTYVMLNKPKGCVCTVKDDKNRKTIFDYVKLKKRLYPVGRLDYDTEGLILLTDDGELTNKITHPSGGVKKTYVVKVEGMPTDAELTKLRKGVTASGVTYSPAKVEVVGQENGNARLNVTISEGKNHEIKNMIGSLGRRVLFLKRVAIGDLYLGGLSRGEWRYLSDAEIEYLKKL